MATFDPYRKWLGIPVEEQPPNHYRLLGIGLFESDHDVISNAADRQMAHVRTFQSGSYSQLSQRLLNELAAALDGTAGCVDLQIVNAEEGAFDLMAAADEGA